MIEYDFVIIGAGIVGCSISYELSKQSDSILIIDKNSDVAKGASGAAGAFLSPLLGKPNEFKDLVNRSLIYSTTFYKENFSPYFNNCGTTRIPQNREDESKFQSYIPFMDFPYTKDEKGYFFKIGSVVDSYNICKSMVENSEQSPSKKFNYEVKKVVFEDEKWIINDEIKAKNIIFATGSDSTLFDQFYLKLRAVWGRRIDITTSTKITHNFHKACSVSQSKNNKNNKNLVSIGATHHRSIEGVEDIDANKDELLKKANDIVSLKDVEIVDHHVGARACSVDYFPIVGEIIDANKTIAEFPYMVNGTNVDSKRFTRFKNLYMLNGVGGRGFVMAPYLAKQLVASIMDKKELDKAITTDRLFKREVKRHTNSVETK